MTDTLKNPYLETFQALPLIPDASWRYGVPPFRQRLCQEYSWAIPDVTALQLIRDHSPHGLLEIGAGGGYWAHLLTQLGVDVLAVDALPCPRPNPYAHREWHTDVRPGSTLEACQHPERSLFLCWPVEDGTADHALFCYAGSTLIYVGEGHGGCTADPDFFRRLQTDWSLKCVHDIPHWPGIEDRMYIYERRTHDHP